MTGVREFFIAQGRQLLFYREVTALLASERFSSLNTKPNLWFAIFYSPFTPLSAVCGLPSILKTKRV
jgi:hypothetical protein